MAVDVGPDWTGRPWRIGRKVGRTLYAQLGEEPSDDDPLIGVMDYEWLATRVVSVHNFVLERGL